MLLDGGIFKTKALQRGAVIPPSSFLNLTDYLPQPLPPSIFIYTHWPLIVLSEGSKLHSPTIWITMYFPLPTSNVIFLLHFYIPSVVPLLPNEKQHWAFPRLVIMACILLLSFLTQNLSRANKPWGSHQTKVPVWISIHSFPTASHLATYSTE